MQDPLIDRSCRGFAEALASRQPVPGGGGAAAYAGALGSALCAMVARFDEGKPSMAERGDELARAVAEADVIRAELLGLVDEDARAYATEAALHEAVRPPYQIMGACARAIELLEGLSRSCSRLLLSDVGCGAMLCRGALDAANLTVCVNTASMRDRAYAREIDERCVALLSEWEPRAQAIADHAIGVMKRGQSHG